LKSDILRVPPIQLPTKKSETWVLLMKFHRRMNLTALLVTILGSRNKNKHSEFWYFTSQRYLLYKFRLKKDKPWVFLNKFRCRTNLMHFILHTNMWQVYTRPTSASDFSLTYLVFSGSTEAIWKKLIFQIFSFKVIPSQILSTKARALKFNRKFF
jgi:hypothetical protein